MLKLCLIFLEAVAQFKIKLKSFLFVLNSWTQDQDSEEGKATNGLTAV